ncbi:MAG: alpha/beta fold hydrolase [Desulfobacterales bacterium]|nr:alpha/beta fold hydrolase [Desulfobacterales bacterium]
MTPYNPPAGLGNRHVQSILASLKLRRPFVYRRAKAMLDGSRSVILSCPDGTRLEGKYARNEHPNRGLAILIHGWEGSADSTYIVSAAGHLYARGFDIFRLNLRDHGDTHHLNPGLFHCCRLDEVVGAVQCIAHQFPHEQLFLGGFSLGGNFGLRVAARAPDHQIHLNRVVAISPVVDPAKAMAAMESGWWVYHAYFMNKWRKSLAHKQRCFPDMQFGDLARHKTITQLTAYLTARFTRFPDTAAYYQGYTLTEEWLRRLKVPAHIIASLDDPVIPAEASTALARGDFLTVETTRFGGHCGFLRNWRLQSWAEERMADLFLQD